VKTRILTAVVVAALAVATVTGCSVSVAPGQQVAYEVFAEVVALQKENPVEQAELAYKTPAGVVLYADGGDVADPGEDSDPRYSVVVVNLADGVVFAEQYPGGSGVQRFESVQAYAAWMRQQDAALPDIPSVAFAYAENVNRAQRIYYEEHGGFATGEKLVAWSASPANLAPDVTPPDGSRLAVTADASGYLTLATTSFEEKAVLALGYCASSPSHFIEDLGSLVEARAAGDDILFDCMIPADDGTYRAEPFAYVALDPAALDENGRVAVVELPAFAP
jgi:hypothetical protein